MPSPVLSRRPDNRERLNIRLILSALVSLGLVAIVFTILVIQLQSATTAYLSGLAVWSRGQVESVRQTTIYARTGDPAALKEARRWYEIPVGDMEARPFMSGEHYDFEQASKGLIRGANHPDDVPPMIWMFRLLHDAPYFRDAIDAWRDSDLWILKLGTMMNKLEAHWQTHPSDEEQLSALRQELNIINQKLAEDAARFRDKMSLASRALVSILSITTILFFLLLSSIATILIVKLTAAIRSSEHKFRKTFEHAAMGIAQIDRRGFIIEANNALSEILKHSRSKLLKSKFSDLVHPNDRDQVKASHNALAQGEKESLRVKQRFCCGDGSVVWANTTLSRYMGRRSESMRYICILEDVSEQHRLSEELNYQARHDALTGLVNRRAFEHYLEENLVQARKEQQSHCLCFIDLDRFKIVNDTSGHFAGDEILQQVAQRLSGHLRKGDVLARLGGDEFGLILSNCEADSAAVIADSLLNSLNESPFIWEGKRFSIGCSIGIVPITEASGDAVDLLQAADSACNMAKEKGRNRILLTDHGDEVLAARRTQLEWVERIRAALNNNQLFLDAQRIVPVNSDSRVRIEVLLRMRDKDNEIILPGTFLPAAERFGIAHLLDRWVIENVCIFLKENRHIISHIAACHINISGRSFDHEDFTHFVLSTLQTHHIPPEVICFEITETAAIANLNDVRNFMSALTQAGTSFALDDFGAGLSSFAYLKHLPVDILKIDGTFVRNMANDEIDRAMVRAINDVGQTLDKAVVAEFVEDEESLNWLKRMDVQFGQGFHLHKPENLTALFRDNSR